MIPVDDVPAHLFNSPPAKKKKNPCNTGHSVITISCSSHKHIQNYSYKTTEQKKNPRKPPLRSSRLLLDNVNRRMCDIRRILRRVPVTASPRRTPAPRASLARAKRWRRLQLQLVYRNALLTKAQVVDSNKDNNASTPQQWQQQRLETTKNAPHFLQQLLIARAIPEGSLPSTDDCRREHSGTVRYDGTVRRPDTNRKAITVGSSATANNQANVMYHSTPRRIGPIYNTRKPQHGTRQAGQDQHPYIYPKIRAMLPRS